MSNQLKNHVEKIKTKHIADKIGTYLQTGFLSDSIREASFYIKEMNESFDFNIKPESRMQVFEKLGQPHYSSNEEMQASFDAGISSMHYINNELGEKLAKKECLRHFVFYMSNIVGKHEARLYYLKAGIPLFLMGKGRKDKYLRLSKKLDIIKSIANGDLEAIKTYDPTQDVYRLDMEKELSVIEPLSSSKDFYFVDTNKIKIKKVKAVIIGYRDYFVDNPEVDGHLEYGFYDEDGVMCCHYFADNVLHLESKEIKINTAGHHLFYDRTDAIALLKSKQEKIRTQIEKTLSSI